MLFSDWSALQANGQLFSRFNAKSTPDLLFGVGQCPFQVGLHCLRGSVWLSLLDGLKYPFVLLCICQQQCLCASRSNVEYPTLCASCRSYRRGEEWIVRCLSNHSMKGSIGLAELLALLGLGAPLVEGHHLAQFPQFMRRNS